jgi:hypothetical protein
LDSLAQSWWSAVPGDVFQDTEPLRANGPEKHHQAPLQDFAIHREKDRGFLNYA